MPIQVSQRGQVTSMAEAVSAHARQVLASGQQTDMIYMNVGQPSTGAPERAMQALNDYAQQDILGYTPVSGLPLLKNRIAQHYQEDYGVTVDPERIFITFGASGAFILTFLGLFDAGQKIALPLPCYPAYLHTMEMMGLTPVLLPTKLENNYQPTIEDIENCGEKFDAIVLTSPGNPTGSMMSPDELKTMIDYCHAHDIMVISDEIYHGITFDPNKKAETALAYSDHVLVMNSFSKYYSAPGWRCGWMVLPEHVVGNIANVARNMYVSPNAPSQIVAAACFDCRDELNQHVQRYAANRDLLMRELPKAGFIDAPAPDGAFYYYAKVDGLQEDSLDFCKAMMEATGVVAAAGSDFDAIGGKHYVRFSYAGSTERMQEAVRRLQSWR